MISRSEQQFHVAALLLLVVLAWVVAWYLPTAQGMASIWWRSETFAHGLMVLPISAWLVWRKRHVLAPMRPKPTLWMLVPVALAGAAWLLGELVRVNALSYFSLVSLLVFAFVGVIGWRLARVLAFPILFLFFAVPVGEFLMPTLMHYTAEFTVAALRFSGVPVYQEGLFFVIPNGRWSVVEACSGLRYLIASIMVGTLYAYLNYVSLKRRLLFVGVAMIVPIVANWLRAYLIVMLGYLTDNRVAAGVDHLIYGWIFFGVVILLMFWVGSYWREDDRDKRANVSQQMTVRGPEATSSVLFKVVPFLAVMAIFPPLHARLDAPVQPFEIVLKAPAPADGWYMVDQKPFDYVPRYSGYRGHIYQSYRNRAGETVTLFLAYYARQREGSELVAWSNRLTSRSEDGRWMRVLDASDPMPPGQVSRTVIADEPRRLAVWHWYSLNGRVVLHDYEAKARIALEQFSGRADDAAFVAVMAPTRGRGEEQVALVHDFLEAHGDDIRALLDKARESS